MPRLAPRLITELAIPLYVISMRGFSTVVAIVDDDDAVRRALIRLVRTLSYQTNDFPCGARFIESLGDVVPDCLLLDYHMPHADGIQVIKDMEAAGFSIPTIIMSGFDRPGLRAECLSSGAVAYLLKPLTAQTLSTAIALTLQGSEDRSGSKGTKLPKRERLPRCVPINMA